jgi:ABC-type transport system involved in multi-copper enzyme maturation permease subunit
MIARLKSISLNTFREAVRDRVLYNLVLFVLLLLASAPLFGQISIGLEKLILINVGLSAISLFGVIIAILIGIGLVYKEIEKKTLYTILSRPVRRWEFIVGKYLGLVLTLVVNAVFMTAGFYAALLIFGHGLTKGDAALLVAIYFIVLQLLMITAMTLLFSSFSTPIFSAVFAFAFFVIGTMSDDLRGFAAAAKGATKWLVTAAAYLVPDLSSLNVISQVAHENPIGGKLVVFNTIYAVLYSAAALAAAILIFERRDLK